MPMQRVDKKKLAAPKPVTADDIAMYYENKQEIKRLTAENDAISKRIKTQYEPADYVLGDFVIELQQTIGTLKKPLFMHEYPPSDFPELYEMTPSTEAIKENLGEDRAEFYEPVLRLNVKLKN